MSIRRSAKRIILTLDAELVEWLTVEAYSRDRERSWMVQELVRRYRRRLDRERSKRRQSLRDRVAWVVAKVSGERGDDRG